jgi:uncharacterized membrane protein
MKFSGLHYFPLSFPVLLLLLLVAVVAIALIQLRILQYAYEKIGIQRQAVFLILLGSLLGSYVNLPVAQLRGEVVETNRIVWVYGMPYVVPAVEHWPGTVLAVNVGGALIPAGLSLYLLFKNGRIVRTLIAVAIVTGVVHLVAHPVKGMGIAVPTLIPPLVAALSALLLSPRAPAGIAYIAGSMGTLIGADLLNLSLLSGLGAPVASIGGAGTFDGVFLSGILAVLLA